MKDWIVGHKFPPALVGAVRGALVAAGIAIIEALLSYFTTASLPGVGWLVAAPLITAGLRSVEGMLDTLKVPPPDPAKAELTAANAPEKAKAK